MAGNHGGAEHRRCWSYCAAGPLRVEWAGVQVALGTPQAKQVFAVLLLHANEIVSVHALGDELWGERPPECARVQIQGLVSRLRRAMRTVSGRESTPMLTVGRGYLLRVERGELDLDRFRANLDAARRHVAAGEQAAGIDLFRATLQDWPAAVFADVDCPAAASARDQFAELRADAVEDCAEAELGIGLHRSVLPVLAEVVRRHPFRERPCRNLMIALARSGRVADALQVYQDLRARLIAELGIEPSPEVAAVHTGILRAEPTLRG